MPQSKVTNPTALAAIYIKAINAKRADIATNNAAINAKLSSLKVSLQSRLAARRAAKATTPVAVSTPVTVK
jgi:hypothetical protein